MSKSVESFVLGILMLMGMFVGLALLTEHRQGTPSSSYSSPQSYTYTPSSSIPNEPDWDAARRAGFSEADIEAAKSYQNVDRLSNEEQEDLIIYNTLKQLGYSESEAYEAAYN